MKPESARGVVGEALRKAENVLVVSHIRPDGDAIGALLGLGLSLLQAGKTVQIVSRDGVPPNLRFLQGSERVQRSVTGMARLIVVVDCSDLERTGDLLEGEMVDINIDHHVTNLHFARHNLVEPKAVATSAILAECLPEWGLPMDASVASALLTGIITDTIGFRTSNMNPAAMRLAADLMEKGANLPEVYRRGLVQKTFEAARFWGAGLVRLQRSDSLLWTTLRQADRQEAGYPGNDDADLVNMLSGVDGDIVIVFNEQKSGKIKVSWRARPGLDISVLALQFGGGGHPAAAGAEVPGSLSDVEHRVLEATRKFLDQQAGTNGKGNA